VNELPPRFAFRTLRIAVALVVVYWLAQKGHYFMYQGF
jgi:hypothetical protein